MDHLSRGAQGRDLVLALHTPLLLPPLLHHLHLLHLLHLLHPLLPLHLPLPLLLLLILLLLRLLPLLRLRSLRLLLDHQQLLLDLLQLLHC